MVLVRMCWRNPFIEATPIAAFLKSVSSAKCRLDFWQDLRLFPDDTRASNVSYREDETFGSKKGTSDKSVGPKPPRLTHRAQPQ